jgi:hypothetical protein
MDPILCMVQHIEFKKSRSPWVAVRQGIALRIQHRPPDIAPDMAPG